MRESLEREGLKLAIKRNELDEFLEGRGMYNLGNNPFVPGESMLNLGPAMSEIYRYYKDEPNDRIDLLLEKTMLDWLTWKSGIGVFAVFSFLSFQLKMEKNNESPFKIDSDKLIKELKNALIIYEYKLKQRKEYEGEGLSEGLWEAMQIQNDMNIKNYGIKIL